MSLVRRGISLSGITATVLTFFFVFSAVAQEFSPDVQEVFRLFSEGRDEVKSMQARFTQMTMTPDDESVSEGSIVYVNPKRIIFRYDEPPIAYMIDLSDAYEYDEELEQILVYDIEDRPEAEAFFLGLESDTTKVQEAYDMRLLPAENPERDAFALELVPIPIEEEEPVFEKVTLQLRKGDYLPTRIFIVNDEDSTVLFKLDQFILNAALPRDRSHLFVPENTDVVINDVAMDPAGAAGRFFPDPLTDDEPEDTPDDE